MRVLFCTTGLLRGGAEAQAVALACRLKSRGHDLCFVCLTEGEANWPELGAQGIAVYSLRMRRGRPGLLGFLRLVQIWRKFRPDAVHGHMFHANIAVRLARLLGTRASVISTAHSIHEGGRWRSFLYQLTDPLSDMTTNVSCAAFAAYAAKRIAPSGRLAWVPNGIDLEMFKFPVGERAALRRELGWAETDFVWFAAGRLAEPKDYPTMIAAFGRLNATGVTGWRLAIAGEGPLRGAIEQHIAEAGLGAQVTLLGLRGDVLSLMNAADAYVMSSAWEGLPMVLLEASAAGLPIVATRVGGNAEIVVPGRTGFLVPAGAPRELTDALNDLMKAGPSVRVGMGEKGRQLVAEDYAIDRIVGLWEEGYSDPDRLRRTGFAPPIKVPHE